MRSIANAGNDRGIDLAETVALLRIAHAVDHHQRARRRAGIELAQIDARAAFVVGGACRHRSGIDVELRDGAEQIRRRQRARHREILRREIDHRNAHRRGAADQRACDQHGLGDFLRLRHHLGGINAFRLRERQQ